MLDSRSLCWQTIWCWLQKDDVRLQTAALMSSIKAAGCPLQVLVFGPILDDPVRAVAQRWLHGCQVLLLTLHASMNNHLHLCHRGDPRLLRIPYPLRASYSGSCKRLRWLSALGQQTTILARSLLESFQAKRVCCDIGICGFAVSGVFASGCLPCTTIRDLWFWKVRSLFHYDVRLAS